MATIDEILDAMPEEDAETGRDYLVIDPLTRTIIVPGSESVFGVTGDELADRKYFMCPRYVGDGLDLAGMFIRVNYRNAGGDEDGYLVDDVAVVGDYVTFSWRLWPKVTEYKGPIQFSVCADLPNTAERRFPDWNTTMATGEVLEGLHPYDGAVEEETRDVVTQLRAETAAQTAAVTACGAEQVQAVQDAFSAETAAAVAQVAAKGAATLATIPEDYTALAAQVDKLTRDRAAAIVCQAEGTAIQVQDASNDPLHGLRIFGRSTQDGTPTPDAPVGIVSLPAPVVRVYGKNLITSYVDTTKLHNGVTFTVNNDGSITVDGTATEAALFNMVTLYEMSPVIRPGAKYTISGATKVAAIQVYEWQGTWVQRASTSSEATFTLSENAGGVLIRYVVNPNLTADNLTVYPMLRLASNTDGTYEQGKPGQTLTVTTPDSLPGIPVASGGNYTDAAGQEWICDEVDLARGVYVQRIGIYTLDGGESITREERPATNSHRWLIKPSVPVPSVDNKAGLCSHFSYGAEPISYNDKDGMLCVYSMTGSIYGRYDAITTPEGMAAWLSEQAEAGTPVTIKYVLGAPIEATLSDVELQAFLALQSYKPTTTVLNDAGAHMALEYAADPKLYIDNKLAALVAANN